MFTLFCRCCWREERAGWEESGSSACRAGWGAGGWCPPELRELPARASCCKRTKINVQIEGGGNARVWLSSWCKIGFHSVDLTTKLLLISDIGSWVAYERGLITKVLVYRLKGVGLPRFTHVQAVRLSPPRAACRLVFWMQPLEILSCHSLGTSVCNLMSDTTDTSEIRAKLALLSICSVSEK